MAIELRLPKIQGNDREQLVQIRSYLYQLTEQLQWALNNINTTASSQEKVVRQEAQVMMPSFQTYFDADVAFEELKSLIIKSADIVEAYYDEINTRLKGMYVAQSDFGDFIEKTEQNIKATSTYVEQKFDDVQVIISDEVKGLNYSFNSAIDATDSRITNEVTNLNNTFNSAIDATGSRIDVVNEQIDEINNTVETIDTEVKSIDGYVNEVGGQVEGINTSVSQLTDLANVLNDSVNHTGNVLEETNAKVDEATGDVQNLKAAVEETTEKVEDLNSAIADANTDIESLKASILETNAYIRSGLLYYGDNSFPVYGLEIGQRNIVNGAEVFNKYARFTSDRLSFYDQNDTEVAYISDYKLYIRNVEITDSFKIGGFVDTTASNGDVVTKWVGGNG